MKNQKELRCNCRKIIATIINGEPEFRGVNIDWVRVPTTSTPNVLVTVKCRGCYKILSIDHNFRITTNQKQVGLDLLNNYKRT